MNCLLSTRAFRKTLLVTGHLCECSRPRYPRQPSVWIIVHGDARYILRLPESDTKIAGHSRDPSHMQLLFAQGHPGSPNKIVDQLDRLQRTRPPGQTTYGQLPEIAARRVRARLPPPPPSRPDARTPGSCRGKRGVFRGFQASSAGAERGAETRQAGLGRGGAPCPRDRLASPFSWSGLCTPRHPSCGRRMVDRTSARPNAVARVSQPGGWIPAISLDCP